MKTQTLPLLKKQNLITLGPIPGFGNGSLYSFWNPQAGV